MVLPERWRGLPVGEYAFPGPLRDRLVAAIAAGTKTSTTSLVVDHEVDGAPLPAVGDREVVVDSHGQPVLVTQVDAVAVLRLGEVGLAHALDEGEGHTSVAGWRRGHERFWGSEEYRADIGDPSFRVDDDTLVVCVAFTVVDRC